MNYYRRYIGDYGKKTPLLSLAEHGAYALMLDHYYAEEAPLPADREEIYRLARCTKADERKAVDKVLAKYFNEQPDGFHNVRADEELKRAKPAIDAAKVNGAKGGRPATIIPMGSDTETHRDTPLENPPGSLDEPTGIAIRGGDPTTNHHPPTANRQPPHESKARKRAAPSLPNADELLADVDAQVRKDWLAIRSRKRLPLTQTAHDEIRAEVARAGLTMEAALRICCRKGWASFDSKWDWRGVNGQGGPPSTKTPKQAEAERFIDELTGRNRSDGSDHGTTIEGTASRLD